VNVLVFSKYSTLGASSRVRIAQYTSILLQNHGVSLQFQCLFSNRYLQKKYNKKLIAHVIVAAYFRRILSLLHLRIFSNKYDVILVEKEFFPYLPFCFERLLTGSNLRYVVDFDDAIFHNYDKHPSAIIRGILSKKIPHVVKNSCHVICGNRYLESMFVKFRAKQVTVIPSVIDNELYPQFPVVKVKVKTIGWIGSPSTFKYIKPLLPLLSDFCCSNSLHLLIVGSGCNYPLMKNVIWSDWSQGKELELLGRMDIGLMPLFDGPFELGKCGYKLIQYMAAGVIPIASPVGANLDIIDQGATGFFASSPHDWINAIKEILSMTVPERSLLINNGVNQVSKKYSIISREALLFDVLFSNRIDD